MFVYFNFVAKRPLRNFFTTENIPIYGSYKTLAMYKLDYYTSTVNLTLNTI